MSAEFMLCTLTLEAFEESFFFKYAMPLYSLILYILSSYFNPARNISSAAVKVFFDLKRGHTPHIVNNLLKILPIVALW